MSDLFEALAEPATPSSDVPEVGSGPDEVNVLSPPAPADNNPSAIGESAEPDGTAAARPKRAPRRSSSRARRAPPAPDPGPAAEAPLETPVAAPAPLPARRRRSRKSTAEAARDGVSPVPSTTPGGVESAPLSEVALPLL